MYKAIIDFIYIFLDGSRIIYLVIDWKMDPAKIDKPWVVNLGGSTEHISTIWTTFSTVNTRCLFLNGLKLLFYLLLTLHRFGPRLKGFHISTVCQYVTFRCNPLSAISESPCAPGGRPSVVIYRWWSCSPHILYDYNSFAGRHCPSCPLTTSGPRALWLGMYSQHCYSCCHTTRASFSSWVKSSACLHWLCGRKVAASSSAAPSTQTS